MIMKFGGPMPDQTMPDQSLGFLMNDATRLMRRRFEKRAAGLGLTIAQWRLLFCLKREGTQSQARLAEQLEIKPITMSRLIDRMQEAGWVCREHDPFDRRIKRIHPTAKAEAVFREARDIAEEIYQIALRDLTDEEVDRVMVTLKHIIGNLSECSSDRDCRN